MSQPHRPRGVSPACPARPALTRFASLALVVAVVASLAGLAPASRAAAQEVEEAQEPRSPFDRHLAVGAYLTGWAGSYLGGGAGGRLRWEPFDELGVEVFGEGLYVESPAGIRHDWPVGFNLYIPIELDPIVRLRPLFGFCAVFSFVEPEQEHAPRADDILFGLHGGLGVEVAVHSMWTLFLDAQVNGWLGHDRAAGGWTGGVDGDYSVFWNAQIYAGTQLHFDI